MSDQVRNMELFRKRLTSCRKTFVDAKNLLSKRKQNDSATMQKVLEQINIQLLWIRQAESKLECDFTGRHAETLRNDLVEMAKTIESEIASMLSSVESNIKIGKTHSEWRGIVESTMQDRIKKRPQRIALTTQDTDGNSYKTSLLIYSNVRSIKGDNIPIYMLALSEKICDDPTLRIFLSHLSSINVTFDPTYEVVGAGDLLATLKRMLAYHFSPSYTISLKEALAKVKNWALLDDRQLEVTLKDCLQVEREEVTDVLHSYIKGEFSKAYAGSVMCKHAGIAKPKLHKFVFESSNYVGFQRVPDLLNTLGIVR